MAGATVFTSGGQQQQPQPQIPKPPRRCPYRDGQSQAAQYYDLFEMIRHPHLSRGHRPPDPPPQKKFGSKQQMIEHELEKKYQRTSKKGLLIALIRGCVFVTVWPFMFLFFALPNWIYKQIHKGLTAVREAIARKIEAIRLFFIRKYRGIVDPVKDLWKRMGEREKNKQVKWEIEAVGFFTFIALGLYYAYSGFIRPTIRGIKISYRGVIEAYRWAARQPQKVKESLKGVQMAFQKVMSYPKKLLMALKLKLTNFILHPLQMKLKSIYNKITEPFIRLGKGLEEIAGGIKKTLLRPIETGVSVKNWVIQSIQNRINQVKQTIRNALRRPVILLQAMQKSWQSFTTAIHNHIPTFTLKIPFSNRFRAIQNGLKIHWERMREKLQWKQKIAAQVNRFKEVLNFKPFIVKISVLPYLQKLLKLVQGIAFTQIERLQKKLRSLKRMVLQPFFSLVEKAKQNFSKFKVKLFTFLRPIRRFFHRRILRLRVMIGWIRIIARQSLHDLRP